MNKYFANQKELLTVASIIFAETKIEKQPAQTLLNAIPILTVGFNRLYTPRFKCSSLYEVFTKPKQFSCYPDSKQFKKAMNGKLMDKEAQAFNYIMFMLDIFPFYKKIKNEILFNCQTSNHYYNPKLCSPNWAQGVPVDYTIGNHNFLTLP